MPDLPPSSALSKAEYERLVGLFESEGYPRGTRGGFEDQVVLGAEPRAALMANNTPAVARKWLEEEGLLDEQQS